MPWNGRGRCAGMGGWGIGRAAVAATRRDAWPQSAGMYQVPFWSIQYSEVVTVPSGQVWVTVQC